MNIRPPTRWAAACGLLVAIGAHAADSDVHDRGWLHIGVGHAAFELKADASFRGGPYVELSDAKASSATTLVFDVGYEVVPNVIVSMMGGVPATSTLSSEALGGDLGKVQLAPAVFSVHYHFDLGILRPYVGGGGTYLAVLDSRDGGMKKLKVKSAWGWAAVAGVDVPITRTLDAYVDVRRLFAKTTATAFDGAARGHLEPKPLIVSTGVTWRF